MANKQINKFIKKLSSFAIFDNDDVRPIIKEEISTIKEEIRQEIIVEIEIKEKVIIQILRNIDTDEDTIRDIIDVFTDLK